ncbi:pimeloyl-ACP methyl ester carboxylesterase [Streptomyces sp. V4I2]|nr:pimeloyl-ACP methyl ester carboxylesterase [Streptomyces sp. V4I2]
MVSFLTGDVERYRGLDATGAALREVHDRGDDMLRFRLAERARAETCLEWVRAVVGERPSGQFAVVTDRDWSAIAGILGATGRWESLWRLVFAAPPAWGARMLRMAMLVDAEQNRQTAQKKLDIPVLALGGSAFIGDRNESQMRLMAHAVTGHTFAAGHDLAEEVPDEMADVVLPFLATHQ